LGRFVMKVITVNRYNVLSEMLTACFETRKGEPIAAVMYQWRAVFEVSVLEVHSRVYGLLLSVNGVGCSRTVYL
jgi:hypothetical protein